MTVADFSQPTMKIVYLRKSGDDVISFCKCGDGRITFPAQLDCPWCGCGWLFSCISCRKAFTFAEGIELDSSWEELAKEDERGKSRSEPDAESTREWIEAMKEILRDVKVGEKYVILDGSVLPANATHTEFNGWHAHHRFDVLPQFAALDDKAILEKKLGNRSYWDANALSEEE